MIEAATRLQGVEQLIDMEQYFVIHAARQSGKTTYLNDLAERLNASGNYYALYCSLEVAQGITEPKEGIPEIVRKLKDIVALSDIPQRDDFSTGRLKLRGTRKSIWREEPSTEKQLPL
jgi:hypothetical protein